MPQALDALNRHNLQAWLKGWADDATFVYPGNVALSGTHRGKEVVRAFFERYFEQFPTVHFTAKHIAISNVLDMTGTNVVAVNWEAEATNRDGMTIYNSGVSVTTLRWGKIVRMQEYIFDTGEAFRAAWGERLSSGGHK